MEGAALYTAAAEFGRRALTMVSIICGITFEGEQESFCDLPAGGADMEDMLRLALDTVTAE